MQDSGVRPRTLLIDENRPESMKMKAEYSKSETSIL